IIMQAANTGLTGGSTPEGRYDRDVVLISTTKLDRIVPIDHGRQVVCLPGARLNTLEKVIEPYGREPHSVIGSSCIGASVVGGVCNNSGGSLISRGPAYTECALFARIDEDGHVNLINKLGISVFGSPETILSAIEGGNIPEELIEKNVGACSAHNYNEIVRDTDAPSPARYNADPSRLFDTSGCAGKLIVFAVRLDTFPKAPESQVFYVGTNSPAELEELRRGMLGHASALPDSAEYVHREAFDIALRYGKDTFAAIRLLGEKRLPFFFSAKSNVDDFFASIGLGKFNLTDRVMQLASRLLPMQLPKVLLKMRDQYEHHLIIEASGDGVKETQDYLSSMFPSLSGDFHACSKSEGAKAMLHRFVTAGAAVRYAAVHSKKVSGIAAIDVALPRSTQDWVEVLPDDLRERTHAILYYGHFFCHVFHQDYVVKKGCDPHTLEEDILMTLDARGAKYPAEHNVGHMYNAEKPLRDFYQSLDPTNSLNPGIGKTSKLKNWETPYRD
ncbi:MAG: D-lactate dehydrogenase, partial [Pseudomonadota bacterium]